MPIVAPTSYNKASDFFSFSKYLITDWLISSVYGVNIDNKKFINDNIITKDMGGNNSTDEVINNVESSLMI